MKNFKKILCVLAAALVSVSLASCSGNTENNTDDTQNNQVTTDQNENNTDGYTIGVIQYVSHPSLDNCYAGVEQALVEKYGDNITIERQIGSDASADSDCSTYAKQFAAKDVDMMIAIATPAASPAFAASEDKDIPVVFCAVSDPVSVGLVQSMEKPGYNCSGTSDVLDMDAQVNLIKAIQPDVKTIGVLYTTSEANSIAQLELLTAAAQKQNIEVISSGIQNDADIPAAAAALVEKVDCLNNFTDNKIVNNLSVVLDAANSAGIPVYGSEIEQVKNGCLASVSIDYVALGKVTGEMAIRALEGESLAEMPVQTISDATPVVNTEVMASFGFEMPEGYENAETVVTNK
ncbi:MAG: ABC transporter substrate-binding protein [Clostridiales bacterium]|nr:MAG: ABC transporter substrate-binding protein [Clostridiales bacterium]